VQRRALVVAPALALVLLPARRARAIGADAAVLLVAGGRPALLRRLVPASGPLARHATRPGAWYALLYLAMVPDLPVQLRLWPTGAEADLVLTALDAAPDEAPTVAHRLPLEADANRPGTPVRWSRFMLPAASLALGLFVLVELKRADGERPSPWWAQLDAAPAPREERPPWWVARTAPGDAAQAPPSPLTQQARVPRNGRAYEVPILSLLPAPESGGWR
jgi:hypothetical protein